MSVNHKVDVNILLPIWGEKFTTFFLGHIAAFLSQPINKDFFDKSSATYNFILIISTTYADGEKIRDSGLLGRLSEKIEINFEYLDGKVNLSNSHEAMTKAYLDQLRDRSKDGETKIFLFLTPDSVWTSSTLSKIFSCVERQQKKVVVAPGFRVNKPITRSQSRELHCLQKGGYAEADSAKYVLKNFHKLSFGHVFNSSCFINKACSHIYFLGKDFLIAHCFHLHPVLIVTEKKYHKSLTSTVDGDLFMHLPYLEKDYYISKGEFFAIEFSEEGREWGLPGGYPYLKYIKYYAMRSANKFHMHFFTHRVFIGEVHKIAKSDLIIPDRLLLYIRRKRKQILFMNFIFEKILRFRSVLLRVLP